MKLSLDPSLPVSTESLLRTRLYDLFRAFAIQINCLSDGLIHASLNATTTPTSADNSPGDIVKNSNPSELGSASSKYVITGWIYTATGWREMRTLTGN